jgi:competence protein ComFC
MTAASTSAVRPWVDATLAFFYPNLCQVCRQERARPEEGYVCASCRSRPGAIRFIVPPFCARCGLPFSGALTQEFECGNCRELEFSFQFARGAVAAQGLVLDIIHRYKYGRALWFEPFLGELLTREAARVLRAADWDLIVPVPLHPLKRREREFNQAERLAAFLSRATGIPVDSHLIRRILPTRTQTLLSREERTANVDGAFAPHRNRELNGERIVLLDDVFTTGATVNACAKVLRRNGSGSVCVWTVARGL